MPVRPDAAAAAQRAGAGSTLRLSFPGDPARAAGENLQAPGLPEVARAGGVRAPGQLDDLRAAGETHARAADHPRLPAGLRAGGSDFPEGPRAAEETRAEAQRHGPVVLCIDQSLLIPHEREDPLQ